MTQDSFSDDGGRGAAGGSEQGASRALVIAREVRERNVRERRRRQVIYVALIIASILGAVAFGALFIAPRYAAEARFAVRGSSGGGLAASPMTSMLAQGQGGMPGSGFVDGFAVNDFLKSRDCMLQVGKRVNLPAELGVDPGAGTEALYRAYTRAVAVKFNMVEQENVIEVSAFSPASSRKVADVLLALAQEFVARMDEQGVQNTLDVDAQQLRKAQDQAVLAANAVAAWRASNRNIDPEAESTMVMTMIGQIEQELTTAKINYEKVRAFGNPDHPMLRPAQMQVDALQRQLGEARQRLAGSDNSQAARLKTYTQLKNAQTFADNNLAAARDAYQQAFRETTRLRRYLTVIAQPVAQDVPSSPNLGLLALEGLLVGILLAFLTSIGFSVAASERYRRQDALRAARGEG